MKWIPLQNASHYILCHVRKVVQKKSSADSLDENSEEILQEEELKADQAELPHSGSNCHAASALLGSENVADQKAVKKAALPERKLSE